MSRVRLDGVVKRFGGVVAVARVDLDIAEGEFLTLLGPSGCGKTTCLRMIAGFVAPSEGTIRMDDDDVTGVPPQKRGIGMVFQDYALFPHLTLAENIAFGLVERRMDRSAIASRVADMLKLIRLENAAHRYPQEISGGQQQRVALARAVAHPPRVLLMDEPLGALDLKLREAMQQEIRRIQRELKITTVYVTHDQTEAMAMSDRIAVMNAGRIEQLDTPQRIYDAPVTRFAAGFVGRINFFDGLLRLEQSRLVIDSPLGRLHADHAGGAWIGKRVTLAIRPEALRVGPAREGDNAVSGTVIASSFTGNLIHLTLRLADGRDALVELRPGDDIPPTGAELQLSWSPERAVVLLDEPASHLK